MDFEVLGCADVKCSKQPGACGPWLSPKRILTTPRECEQPQLNSSARKTLIADPYHHKVNTLSADTSKTCDSILGTNLGSSSRHVCSNYLYPHHWHAAVSVCDEESVGIESTWSKDHLAKASLWLRSIHRKFGKTPRARRRVGSFRGWGA